jgi:hypothetical protein
VFVYKSERVRTVSCLVLPHDILIHVSIHVIIQTDIEELNIRFFFCVCLFAIKTLCYKLSVKMSSEVLEER